MKRKHLLFSLVVTLLMISGFIGANQVSASETDTSDALYGDLSETELSETIGNLSPDKQDDLFVAIMSKETRTERDEQILSVIRQIESERDASDRSPMTTVIVVPLVVFAGFVLAIRIHEAKKERTSRPK